MFSNRNSVELENMFSVAKTIRAASARTSDEMYFLLEVKTKKHLAPMHLLGDCLLGITEKFNLTDIESSVY